MNPKFTFCAATALIALGTMNIFAVPEPAAQIPGPATQPASPDMNRTRSFLYVSGVIKPSKVTYEFQTFQSSPGVLIRHNANIVRDVVEGGLGGGVLVTSSLTGNWLWGLDFNAEYYKILGNKSTGTLNGVPQSVPDFDQNALVIGFNPLFGYRFSENLALSLGPGAALLYPGRAKINGRYLDPSFELYQFFIYGVMGLQLTWGRFLVSPQFRYDHIVAAQYLGSGVYSPRAGRDAVPPASYILEFRLAVGFQFN